MDFIYLLRVLLKRKWIILGSAVLAAALAWYLTQNETKKYKSSAQISTGYAVKDVPVSIVDNFDPYQQEPKFNTAIVTFTSEPVLNLVSYQLILHDLTSPRPFHVLGEKEKQSPEFRSVNIEKAKAEFQSRLDSMKLLTSYNPDERRLLDFLKLYQYDYKTLLKNISVYRVQRTDFIQVDYTSDNPELSAYVSNNVFQQFLRHSRSSQINAGNESIDTLKAIMDRKKQEVDVKNALLNKNGYYEEGISASTADVAGSLRAAMQDVKASKLQKEGELRRVIQKLAALPGATTTTTAAVNSDELMQAQKAAADALIESEKDPSNATKRSTYERLNNLYLSLRKQYNQRDPVLPRSGESRDDLLDKKADLESEIASYNTTIGSYQAQINQLEGEVASLATRGMTIETLKKERDQANKEYIEARSKFLTAQDVNGSAASNFRQVVYAQPAVDPEPSKRFLMIGMAGGAALITTILIIIFLTYLDNSIKTPIIFQRTVNLKLISLVNFMDLRNKRLEDIVANRNNSETVYDRNKFNAFRESIRKLRYEIESTGKRIFLFTSTKKGQGKTTLIQALSYSMSLSKKRILIIDTNFCNPDLTVQLNAEPILEKIIPYKASGTTLVDQVKKFSKDVGVGTVYAIGAEGGDYTPSEILPRENILHHLQSLTSEFDYIFLEGPPLNDFSDSKELAQYVDGVIAVFSAEDIIKQIDKQSITFFKELNGKFCGSILNMVDLKNVNVS